MKMVGHQTESVYRRYAIVDERMLKEGGARLAALHETTAGQVQAKPARVIALDWKRSAG